MHPVLVIGATGRIGRRVVDQLHAAGVSVRALTRRPITEARLPPEVEVASGDLTIPQSIESALKGIGLRPDWSGITESGRTGKHEWAANHAATFRK